jgi:hypothetical protein
LPIQGEKCGLKGKTHLAAVGPDVARLPPGAVVVLTVPERQADSAEKGGSQSERPG